MTQEERLQEIEHAKDFLIDIIPHNTPNFLEVLQETAEAYVDSMTEQIQDAFADYCVEMLNKK